MGDKIHLEVVTPERRVFTAEVDSVEVPGLDGEIGILAGHARLFSQLKPAGLLTYRVAEEKGEMAISDGFVEVTSDRVTVLADRACRPEDIDLAGALEVKGQAERQVLRAMTDPDVDILRATVELERATIEAALAQRARR